MKAVVNIANLCFRRAGKTIFDRMTFQFEESKIHGLLGSNGSGKSTLLRLLRGKEKPTIGTITSQYQADDIGYLPQDYQVCLLPWRNVEDNILLPLKIRKYSKQEQLCGLERLLSKLQISLPLSQEASGLSGGELQIIALMQRMITQPRLLLLDEPSSALDLERRICLWNFLKDYQLSQDATIIFVSHSFDEVLKLADNVVIIESSSKVRQFELSHPDEYMLSDFVALFTKDRSCVSF